MVLDDAVVPSSFTSSNTAVTGGAYGGVTLNGLWHLNDERVTVTWVGADLGDYVVANGSVFVPYGDSVSAGTALGQFTAAQVARFPELHRRLHLHFAGPACASAVAA